MQRIQEFEPRPSNREQEIYQEDTLRQRLKLTYEKVDNLVKVLYQSQSLSNASFQKEDFPTGSFYICIRRNLTIENNYTQ